MLSDVVGVVVRREDGELLPGRPPRIGMEAMAAVLSSKVMMFSLWNEGYYCCFIL
jgi:hypothetical protein